MRVRWRWIPGALVLACGSPEPAQGHVEPEPPSEPSLGPLPPEAATLERELFSGCVAKPLSEGLTAYECTGLNATLGYDERSTLEASVAALHAGLNKSVAPGADVKTTRSELASVPGRSVPGLSMHTEIVDGRSRRTTDMIAYAEGGRVHFAMCMHESEREAVRERCRRILEFLVGYGAPRAIGVGTPNDGGEPRVRGTLLAVPAGCKSELDEFGGRILCDAAELRWSDVEDIGKRDEILAQSMDAFRGVVRVEVKDQAVDCSVLGVPAKCLRGAAQRLFTTHNIVFAVSDGPDKPLFVSCAYNDRAAALEVCEQLLTTRR
ncbi:MAG TPA: hypothetical protein VG755_33865 [Nannocystaceae bacterium]|nr:hypothetical protein [Nannocystaceae bacterium]